VSNGCSCIRAKTQPSSPNLRRIVIPITPASAEAEVDRYIDTISPGTGESLARWSDGRGRGSRHRRGQGRVQGVARGAALERAKMLRAIAEVLRKNGDELAMIDAADWAILMPRWCATRHGAAQLDFYAASSPR